MNYNVAKLPDGRYFTIELPEGFTERDAVTNELILQPQAIHLLDRLRSLLSPLSHVVTSGRLRLLRESLNWSVEDLAKELQEDPSSVRAWEANQGKPGDEQRAKLEAVRTRITRSGVLLSA